MSKWHKITLIVLLAAFIIAMFFALNAGDAEAKKGGLTYAVILLASLLGYDIYMRLK